MAVNITVNGKFAKHCARNPILDDKERVKKEMEEERRKIRLQQVREESKNLARKIRNDVSAEKNRQLRNLEAIKAQELNCWRENVLAHRNHDYRTAVFQVGQAHHAAQVENCERATRACQRRCCRPVSRPSRNINNSSNKNNVENCRPNSSTCPPRKSINCVQTQTAATKRTQTQRQTGGAVGNDEKPKRTVCFHDEATNCCFCYSADDVAEVKSPRCNSPCEYSNFDSSSCSSDLTSPRKCMRTQAPSLCQTPAVCLDIDVDSSDSMACVRQADICDKYAENNRQFCRTVRKSPPRCMEKLRPVITTPEKKSPPKKPAPTPSTKSSINDRPSTSKAAAEKPKRFSQISDLIAKKKSPTKKTPPKSPPRKATPPAKKPTSPAKAAAPPTAPQRKGSTATIRSSQAASEAPTATLVSTLVDAATSYTGMPPATDTCSDRVQFYDYNNKFAKEYAQPQTITVRVRPSDRCVQPNAMEQACIEQQLRASREQDMEALRKKCEDRCQKAIEREQVRRDCNELTQKLEALMRQHPELIPTDAKVMARHRFTDQAARKETKMNSAIEEILLRPAIITCPEVPRTNAQGDAPSTSAKPIPSDLNLGAPHRYADGNNSASTDSCCSILLGYVDDQSKQIRNELDACDSRPLLQNQDKARKLQSLLERIEQLREALLQELQSEKQSSAAGGGEGGGKNVQQMIDSISDLRREREIIQLDDLNQQQHQKQKRKGQASQGSQLSTTAREQELQQKEAILEQRVREFYQKVTSSSSSSTAAAAARKVVSKSTSSSSGTGGIEFTAIAKNSGQFAGCADKPLEITIKVKGDPNCVEIVEKPKASKHVKSPRRVSTLIHKSGGSPAKLAKKASKKRTSSTSKTKALPPAPTKAETLGRQNSYDSNSTSYRSLPPTLGNQDAAFASHSGDRSPASPERVATLAQQQQLQHTRINPLIAHYVQRLLGMTRNSVLALSVSSSQVETPSSSIVNTTANVTSSTTDHPELLMQERLLRVERFVEENRSFINELEETLRSQDSHASLETSMRAFEEIWRQRLQNSNLASTAPKEATKSIKKTPAKKRTSTAATTKRKSATQKATPKKIKADDVETTTKQKEAGRIKSGEIQRRLAEQQLQPMSSQHTSESNRRAPNEYREPYSAQQQNRELAQSSAATKEGTRMQDTSRTLLPDNQYTQQKYADGDENLKTKDKSRSRLLDSQIESAPTQSGLKSPSRIPQRISTESGIARTDTRTKETSRTRVPDTQHDAGPIQQRSVDSTQNLGLAQSAAKTKESSRLRLNDSGKIQQSNIERPHDISIPKISSKTRGLSRAELQVDNQSHTRPAQQRSADKVPSAAGSKSGSKTLETTRDGVLENRSQQKMPAESAQSSGIAKSGGALDSRMQQKAPTESAQSSGSKIKELSGSELMESQFYSDHALSQQSSGLARAQSTVIAKSVSQTKEATRRAVQVADQNEASTSKAATANASIDVEKQSARYAQLTDNCTNRIAELNELIIKVREEKQRLLEVTLSTVSDGTTRNSTEYLELADGRRISVSSGKSSDQSQSRLLDSNLETLPAEDSAGVSATAAAAPQQQHPLEKHKQTGLSRDSGISMSRPQTAQEQLLECEPISISYGSTSYSYSTSSQQQQQQLQQQRKTRPPPTLRRFSPQLIEDELAHELSTIMEVDTPVTSRVNTSTRPMAATAAPTGLSGSFIPAPPGSTPVSFPTYEEYLQQLNLDITHINPEQSMRIEQEFNALVAALKEARENSAFNYVEFPSLTTYLHDVAANECIDPAGLPLGHDSTPETIENLLACLRIANLTIKSFPSPKTYRQRLRTNTPEGDDNDCNDDTTESTTDASGGGGGRLDQENNTICAETESESMNIEEELKRRNILKSSFRRTTAAEEQHLFASTHREGEEGAERAAIYAHFIAAAESGIEKLSTSDNLSEDLEKDLRGIGMQWPAAMRRKGKVAAALSSTTSTSATLQSSPQQNENQRSYREAAAAASVHFSADNSLNQSGRPINLRDFLTRELLKQTNTSCSSSNTDDSLRSHFFQSILGNITPTCTPRTNGATTGAGNSNGRTLDRQKTSTPVALHSTQSSRGNSSSASSTTPHLFSGESRLSSVHFQDRTAERFFRQPQEQPKPDIDAECPRDPWEDRR